MDLIKPDPALTQPNPEPIVYRCRKCRRILAAKSNLVTHTRINGESASTSVAHVEPQNSYDPLAIYAITSVSLVEEIAQRIRVLSVHNSERSSEADDELCKEIIFVAPIAWMSEALKQIYWILFNFPRAAYTLLLKVELQRVTGLNI